MTLLHLAYAVAVGGLLTGAAALLDAGLRGLGRPARGIWIVVLAATAAAPFWGPRLASRDAVLPVPVTLVAEAPTPAAAPAPPAVWDRLRARAAAPRPSLRWLWLALSGVAVAGVAGGLVRLERRAARWPRTRVEGEPVSVSRDFGPAVVGLRHPRTVLPHWVLGLARRDIGLIVAHERSHRAAGDGVLLAGGLLVAALCPWNPWLWLQFRRLRDAVEMDCDHRLLGSGVSLPAYARVLVTVRLRSAAVGGATAALVESSSSLERRLKMMRAFPWTRRRVALSGAVALGLIVLACETPAPSAVEVDGEIDAQVAAKAEYQEQAAGMLQLQPAPSGEPLVVVDGEVATAAGLAAIKELSPERIHSVEVVKGEAARAVYGEQGAHGVIHVTTVEGALRGEGEVEQPAGRYETVRKSRGDGAGTDIETPIILEGREIEKPTRATYEAQEIGNVPFGIRERSGTPVGEAVTGGVLRRLKERPARDGGGGR